MPSFGQLLTRLERFDTYPAADALSQAMEECFGASPDAVDPSAAPISVSPAQQAGTILWEEWKKGSSGSAAWTGLVEWADERLTAWHSLKVNAVESAWQADSTGADVEAIRREILINLRQGITDDPTLLPDAHFLQALAQQNHSFSFAQALRELRNEALDLPQDDRQLMRHCAICANAFKYLIT